MQRPMTMWARELAPLHYGAGVPFPTLAGGNVLKGFYDAGKGTSLVMSSAADGQGPGSGGLVSGLQDLSGNGFHLALATATGPASVIRNGVMALKFTAKELLKVASNAGLLGASGCTMFAVYEVINTTSTFDILNVGVSANAYNKNQLLLTNAPGTDAAHGPRFSKGDNNNSSQVASAGGNVANTRILSIGRCDGGSAVPKINAQGIGTAVAGSTANGFPTAIDTISLGGSVNSNANVNLLNGYFYLGGFLTGALSDADAELMATYYSASLLQTINNA